MNLSALNSGPTFRALLRLTVLIVGLASCVIGTLLSSSQLDVCVNDGSGSLLATCKKKFVLTFSVDGNGGAGESTLYWSTAVDSASGKPVTLLEPLSLTITKSQPVAQYPATYVRNFNSQAYEVDIHTSLFGCAADSSSASPTCSRAFTASGEPIRNSEGYCCDCSLCDLVGLCNPDSRASTPCSVFGATGAASCLRFGSRWYSGFTLGQSAVQYTITVNVSASSSSGRSGGAVTVGPSKVGDEIASLGVAARLSGDLNPFTPPWDLTSHMLFVPVGEPTDVRVSAGASEWLIVPRTMVTVDGSECNKIGVSYSGFSGQANRCTMARGTCTKNQIEDLRSADVASLAQGKVPTYLSGAFGDFSYVASSSPSPVVAYKLTGLSASILTVSFVADNISYVVQAGNATILWANSSSESVLSNGGPVTLTIVLYNDGGVSAEFSVALEDCSASILPVAAQVATLSPMEQRTLQFRVYAQLPAAPSSSDNRNTISATGRCTVRVYNAVFTLVSFRLVSWTVVPMSPTNGSQTSGGSDRSPEWSSQSVWSSALACPACPWYSPLCFLQQQCFWAMVFQLLGVVVLLAVLRLLIAYRRCCTSLCTSNSSDDSDDDRHRSRHHRRHRRKRHRVNQPV